MDDRELIRDDEVFARMNLAERVQHYLLITTFVTLIATGLPLFFYEFKFFKWILPTGRAFAVRGVLHRVAAVTLAVNLVWHVFYTVSTARGRANFMAMIPRLRDVRDAFEQFMHNTGVTRLLARLGMGKTFFGAHPYWLFREAPRYDRYNFVEKFEYWAVGWGSAVMIASGFFIWHMYNVHLNPEVFPMSKVWLNGKITGHELRTLHPLEYERILAERKRTIETEAL
jgi:formate dehydrogenase subunit gamma